MPRCFWTALRIQRVAIAHDWFKLDANNGNANLNINQWHWNRIFSAKPARSNFRHFHAQMKTVAAANSRAARRKILSATVFVASDRFFSAKLLSSSAIFDRTSLSFLKKNSAKWLLHWQSCIICHNSACQKLINGKLTTLKAFGAWAVCGSIFLDAFGISTSWLRCKCFQGKLCWLAKNVESPEDNLRLCPKKSSKLMRENI